METSGNTEVKATKSEERESDVQESKERQSVHISQEGDKGRVTTAQPVQQPQNDSQSTSPIRSSSGQIDSALDSKGSAASFQSTGSTDTVQSISPNEPSLSGATVFNIHGGNVQVGNRCAQYQLPMKSELYYQSDRERKDFMLELARGLFSDTEDMKRNPDKYVKLGQVFKVIGSELNDIKPGCLEFKLGLTEAAALVKLWEVHKTSLPRQMESILITPAICEAVNNQPLQICLTITDEDYNKGLRFLSLQDSKKVDMSRPQFMKDWSCKNVQDWLYEVGLDEKYIKKMYEEELDGSALIMYEEKDLVQDFFLKKAALRKIIYARKQELELESKSMQIPSDTDSMQAMSEHHRNLLPGYTGTGIVYAKHDERILEEKPISDDGAITKEKIPFQAEQMPVTPKNLDVQGTESDVKEKHPSKKYRMSEAEKMMRHSMMVKNETEQKEDDITSPEMEVLNKEYLIRSQTDTAVSIGTEDRKNAESSEEVMEYKQQIIMKEHQKTQPSRSEKTEELPHVKARKKDQKRHRKGRASHMEDPSKKQNISRQSESKHVAVPGGTLNVEIGGSRYDDKKGIVHAFQVDKSIARTDAMNPIGVERIFDKHSNQERSLSDTDAVHREQVTFPTQKMPTTYQTLDVEGRESELKTDRSCRMYSTSEQDNMGTLITMTGETKVKKTEAEVFSLAIDKKDVPEIKDPVNTAHSVTAISRVTGERPQTQTAKEDKQLRQHAVTKGKGKTQPFGKDGNTTEGLSHIKAKDTGDTEKAKQGK
ncbi:uncharacterized protein [Ptychodera flava]|uniref:uncharacterized protein n=1 Tax=Ptychodera flava TaxID=63121 RepID=UPI003969D3D4